MEKEEEKKPSAEEIAKKFDIDLEKLKREQIKLARNLTIKEGMDFSKVERIGGIACAFFDNNIIAAVVVLSQGMETIEQQYSVEKARFPYVSGFRAYRELPVMLSAYEKLEMKPEVIFINAHGIAHPRLGLASHFSLAAGGVPTIGVADEVLVGERKEGKIFLGGKIVAEEVLTKKESKSLVISPGNAISLKSAVSLARKFVREPHKLPEPLHLAVKYAKKMRDELRGRRGEGSVKEQIA